MLIFVIVSSLFAILFLRAMMKNLQENKRINEQYKKNLEDERIFIPSLGESITYDELTDEERYGDSFYKDTETTHDQDLYEDDEYPIPNIQLTERRRAWLDQAFLFLLNEFGENALLKRKVITIEFESFSNRSDVSRAEVTKISDKLANIMGISPSKIELDFYDSGLSQSSGMYLENDKKNAAGLYFSEDAEGKHLVAIAANSTMDSDVLIATLAHEFSHIKLLGEKRIDENDEHLTDILPLFFGLGIFSANTSFKFSKIDGGWAYSKLGYLSQMDWGYLFALFAHVRKENDPEWLEHLNVSIISDFKLAIAFINENPDKVLKLH